MDTSGDRAGRTRKPYDRLVRLAPGGSNNLPPGSFVEWSAETRGGLGEPHIMTRFLRPASDTRDQSSGYRLPRSPDKTWESQGHECAQSAVLSAALKYEAHQRREARIRSNGIEVRLVVDENAEAGVEGERT